MGHAMQCAAWRGSRRCYFDVTWYKLARDILEDSCLSHRHCKSVKRFLSGMLAPKHR